MDNLSRNNFNALRLALATLVVYSHSFVLTGAGKTEPFLLLTNGKMAGGELAVFGFFAISGFLVTQSWLRSSGPVSYFKKRVLRIYPGFLVAAVFCLLIAGPLGAASAAEYFRSIDWTRFARQALTLGQLHVPATYMESFGPGIVNGPLWTIRIEFECYIGAALLGLLGAYGNRNRVAWLAALSYLSLALLEWPVTKSLAATMVAPGVLLNLHDKVGFVTYFMAGMVLFLFSDRVRFSQRAAWLAAAAIVVSIPLYAFRVVLPIAGTWLLFQLAYTRSLRLETFGVRNDLSYGTYLYAWPVKQFLVSRLGAAIGAHLLFVLATAITFAIAYASWRLVERPALRLKRDSRPESMPGTLEVAST